MTAALTDSLSQRYPRFLETICRPDTKVVVSFGSGGVKLFGHPSVMKFLDSLGARPHIDEIWGCSGGAFAAFAYSLGIPPEEIEDLGEKLFRDGNALALAPSTWSILKIMMRSMFTADGHSGFGGFLSIEQSFRQLVTMMIDGKPLQIPTFGVAFNIVDRRCNTLTPLSFPHDHYRGLIVQAPMLDILMASSSVPILYTPKRIQSDGGERVYLDGSITEAVPLLSVYRKWILDRELGLEQRQKLLILGIDTITINSAPGWFFQKLLNRIPLMDLLLFGSEIIGFMKHAKITVDAKILSEDPDVSVFMLGLPLSGTPFGRRMIPTMIQEARDAVIEGMDRIESSILPTS